MQENESKIKAILDIFSGRPNPTWNLSENQIEELKTKIGKFKPAEPKTPPGLGYRGVELVNIGKIENVPDQIIAYEGVLAITDKGMTKYYEDANRIEEWLLDQAREQGYGEIIKEFRKYSRKQRF